MPSHGKRNEKAPATGALQEVRPGIRCGVHARGYPSLPPQVQAELRGLIGRARFGALLGAEGDDALVWAEYVAILADVPGYECSRSDLVRALRILHAQVKRHRAASKTGAAARKPKNMEAINAAIDGGASVGELVRRFHLPPYTARNYYRERKNPKRGMRLIRGGQTDD